MTHTAVIKGRVYRKIYGFQIHHNNYSIEEGFSYVEDEIIWKGQLDSPLLEPDEVLLIEELNLKVTISSRVRSTNGDVIYSTNHQVRVIEDEGTTLTLEQAKRRGKIHEERLSKEEDVKTPWWKRLFA